MVLSCDTYITKVYYKGTMWNANQQYPLIQIFEEELSLFGIVNSFRLKKSMHYNELASVNEINPGIIELTPREPIEIDDDSIIGLYLPDGSTEFYFEDNTLRAQSCYHFDADSAPFERFVISPVNNDDYSHESLFAPLIAIETSKEI